ncbi:putative isovaleryl-CoA dehydrogenase [Tilletiopsis washingtonensis]|uniref:Putative isovaleryl-CoA dehydrogenase n=1 Tax=Tilletiopsis washingtonensis TaxID=58919 RepID=A0A316ZI50_9BASI|nr:putative isovaleryl-CoA dehydrogenase [Tilletiopsis washingtonensis]PWO00705.1 putative isovaleryl-CoA dehydrogenase [Tilletiopsis washingtonensis]
MLRQLPRLLPRLARPTPLAARTFTSYSAPLAGLTPDQAELREAVADWAQSVVAPLAAQIDRENKAPMDLWTKLGDMGLHGITVPEDEGGLGKGYFEHCVVMEEISRASASVGLSYGAHSNLCINQIARHGTKAQKAKYLPELLAGTKVGSLAMSEPGAGSDVVSMRTTAKKNDSGDWVLNGGKFWITNGPISSTFVIYAKTDPNAGPRGITAFIVDRDTPGFTTAQKLDKVGMRGSETCELVFEDVVVPGDNVLGTVNKGVNVLMSGLDLERLVLSGGPLGLMQAACDYAIKYTHEREQFGQKVAEFQLMQGKIADMYTNMSAARAYVYAVGRACDAGQISRRDCAGAILLSSDAAVEVTTEAMQSLGGNGYINEYPVGRYLRDARLYTVGAGTQEIRRFLIAREEK